MVFKVEVTGYTHYKWFAWYPVHVDEETIVWLGWVERKDANFCRQNLFRNLLLSPLSFFSLLHLKSQ